MQIYVNFFEFRKKRQKINHLICLLLIYNMLCLYAIKPDSGRFRQKNDMIPMRLTTGDKVALVATARKIEYNEVLPAIELFESWGLNVVIPEGLFDGDNQFAGSDGHRATIFQRMLDDREVKAVFCVRGGYGTVRIVDRLDFSCFKRYPKWIVGYSDVTVLHSHIARQCGVATLHAIMPINIPEHAVELKSPAIESLHRCLFDGTVEYRFRTDAECLVKNRMGECKGSIIGGNLSVLYSLLGSSSDIDTEGKILLIEDLDEYLYHIDRMMMAMKRAGKLARLKGLIVGALTDMHDNNVPFGRTAEEIVRDTVSEYGYPVVYYCPFGHIGVENMALPLGVELKMEVGEKYVIIE